MACPHVFLTRFNLPTTKVENSLYSGDWLEHRMTLFTRFTVPSVRAQTAQQVHWIIFLDPKSPPWLKRYMTGLAEEGLATPDYGGRTDNHIVRSAIHLAVGRDRGQVVTSNLDNDDGLAHDFVARLRAAPGQHQRAALYLTEGLIRSGGLLYRRTDPENAFVAVREDLADLVTCWGEWHNRLRLLMPVEQVPGPPGWLQVVHGKNVSNRVRGRITDPAQHRDRFPGLLDDMTLPTRPAILRDQVVRQPTRAIRDTVRGRGAKLAIRLAGQGGLEELKYRLRRGRQTSA